MEVFTGEPNMNYNYCITCLGVFRDDLKECPNKCGATLIENKRKATLYVTWGEHGLPVSDFAVDTSYDLLVDTCNRQFADPRQPSTFHAVYSTGNIFTRIRLGVVRKEFKFNVVFMYRGYEMHLNKYGACDNWVEGFTEYTAHLSETLLTEIIKLHREDKKKIKHKIHEERVFPMLKNLFGYTGENNEDTMIKFAKEGWRTALFSGSNIKLCYNKRDRFYYKVVDELP